MAYGKGVALALLLLVTTSMSEEATWWQNLWKWFEEWTPHIPDKVSTECQGSMRLWKDAMVQQEPWALKMFDASGKIAPGILQGGLMFMGTLGECQELHQSPRAPSFRGTYHIVKMTQTSNKAAFNSFVQWVSPYFLLPKEYLQTGLMSRFEYDLCLPSTCSKTDLNTMLKDFSKAYLHQFGLELSVLHTHQDHIQMTPHMKFAMYVFLLLGGLLLAGTALDINCRTMEQQKLGGWYDILKSFSMLTNWEKLTSADRSDHPLAFLNGIRVLTSTLVMFGHVLVFVIKPTLSNITEFEEDFTKRRNQIISGYTNLTTDTFFFLSAFLIMYLHEESQKRKLTYSYLKVLIWRYWRLVPPYGLCIMFTFVWPVLGSSARWNMQGSNNYVLGNCPHRWWTNLLFITNLFPENNQACFKHGWYLSVEMQLSCFLILLLLPLFKRSSVGVWASLLLVIMSWVYYGVYAYNRNIPAIYYKTSLISPAIKERVIFHQATSRIGTAVVGILTAHFLAKNNNSPPSKSWQIFSWLLCVLCLLTPFVESYIFFGQDRGTLFNAVWLTTRKTIWAVGIGSLVYCCVTGSAGYVRDLLSLPLLEPLGKLTFVTYLTHPLLFMAYNASRSSRYYYTPITFVVVCTGLMVSAYLVGLAAHLAFEAPFEALVKYRSNKGQAASEEKAGRITDPNSGKDKSQ